MGASSCQPFVPSENPLCDPFGFLRNPAYVPLVLSVQHACFVFSESGLHFETCKRQGNTAFQSNMHDTFGFVVARTF